MGLVLTDDRHYKAIADVIRQYGDTPEVAADVTQYLPEEMPDLIQQVALTQNDKGHSEGFGVGYGQGLDEGYSDGYDDGYFDGDNDNAFGHYEAGYEDGYADGHKDGVIAASPHGTASGAVVRLDDVSPLEHTIPVKVSGVDDPSVVTVYAYGKNLYNNVDYGYKSGTSAFQATKTETGYRITGAQGASHWALIPLCSLAELGGKTVTMSATVNATPHSFSLVICDSNYENRKVLGQSVPTPGVSIVSIPNASEYPEGYMVVVRLTGEKDFPTGSVLTYDNIQVELGDKRTAYEPFAGSASYPVNEDGTCEVTSISPSMTLLTDTEGAVLECEYCKDINKVLDQLTQAIISMGGNI